MWKIIQLDEFLEGYKTVEIVLSDSTLVFREPTVEDMQKHGNDIIKLLKKNILEGEWEIFETIYNTKMTRTQQEDIIKQIFEGLGLVS